MLSTIQLPDLDFRDVPAIRGLEKTVPLPQSIEDPDNIRETTIMIPMRDGHQNEAIVCQHAKPSESPSPLVVIIHGGGFMAGSNKILRMLLDH